MKTLLSLDNVDAFYGAAHILHGLNLKVMAGERVALNFLGRLSGIATATNAVVRAIAPHATRVVCTRKTTPLLRSVEKYAVRAGGACEVLPYKDNRITLDGTTKDKWGIPAARIDVRWRENEFAMNKDVSASAVEILEAAGAINVRANRTMHPPGHCIHEMGGARMSTTAKDGVLNGWNQAWDVPNLFITDGAAMSSSACQNPSITYMALTARAVAHAVGELKRRNL